VDRVIDPVIRPEQDDHAVQDPLDLDQAHAYQRLRRFGHRAHSPQPNMRSPSRKISWYSLCRPRWSNTKPAGPHW
jgi:hypothetical protein